MRNRPHEDEATRLAKARRRLRSDQIRAGVLPGLLEKGTKKIRPEIKALIDAALEQRADQKRTQQ
jgi:hypothetical protein